MSIKIPDEVLASSGLTADEMIPHPKQKIDKLAGIGVALAVISLFAALVIAALSFGGVIGMGTVGICLAFAGLVGIAGTIVGATALKPWLREGVRVSLAITACAAVGLGMYWLYGWTERNGSRPTEATAPKSLSPPPANPTSREQPKPQAESEPILGVPLAQPPGALHSSPEYRAKVNQTSSGSHSPNIALNGNGNQIMNNSSGGIQQHSKRANSPNIVTNGPNSPVTTGPNSPITQIGKLTPPDRVILQAGADPAIALLKSSPGSVRFTVIGGSDEIQNFSKQIVHLFSEGTWHLVGSDYIGEFTGSTFDGSGMKTTHGEGLHCYSSNPEEPDVKSALQALKVAGFPCEPGFPLNPLRNGPPADLYVSIGTRIMPE